MDNVAVGLEESAHIPIANRCAIHLKLLAHCRVIPFEHLTSVVDVSADESALVRRCLRNEPDAIRALVERFQADVYSLCMRLLANHHDAEDVTQEVFLRVFRSLRRYDPSRPLKPWIVGIAVNRCRTCFTRRARRPELSDFLEETALAPDNAEPLELLGEIHAAVAELRPEYREVFVLFHEQGQPYEDIAKALKRPVGTIKTWLHRARMAVFERLLQRGFVSSGD